jgi:hypothetical protein
MEATGANGERTEAAPPHKLEKLDRKHGTVLSPGEEVFSQPLPKRFTAIHSLALSKILKKC